MFGHHQKLSIDVEFGVTQPDIKESSGDDYANKLKTDLNWAYKVARDNNSKESQRCKKYYDNKFHCMKLLPRRFGVGQTESLCSSAQNS